MIVWCYLTSRFWSIKRSLSIYLLLFLGIFSLSHICKSDLLQVVSEHFLGQSEDFIFYFFAGIFWAASLQIRYVSLGENFQNLIADLDFFWKKYQISKRKSIESESGWGRYRWFKNQLCCRNFLTKIHGWWISS